MTEVAANLERVRERIRSAADRAGRDPAEIRLVGAMKYATRDGIAAAVAAGLTDLGCNRAQDLKEIAPALPEDVRWHYLGPLQTNKVRYLDGVHLIHGLARAREAEALQARGERVGRSFDVLMEVNMAGEASKNGVAPAEAGELAAAVAEHPLVTLRGVMIVAPQAENHEDVRWVFTEARRLSKRLGLPELSMGMTDDFEVAIEEGATIVRIGRAIFH